MVVASQDMDVRYSPAHPDGIRRVQVGCGPEHLRIDWWNTDLRPFPGIDDAMDATQPWPWPDRLDFVYAEHFLEHLYIDQAVAFLVEAGRALRVGGRIRLTTPCVEWVLKTHFSFQPPGSPEQLTETLHINRAFFGWGHRFLYSRGMLELLVQQVGYEDVRFFRYGESDAPALRNLELHENGPDAAGYPSQWIIEGERGETEIAPPEHLLARLKAEMMDHVLPGH